jgi:hypothetical protein
MFHAPAFSPSLAPHTSHSHSHPLLFPPPHTLSHKFVVKRRVPLTGAELEEYRNRQAEEREAREAEERTAHLQDADMDGDAEMRDAGTHAVLRVKFLSLSLCAPHFPSLISSPLVSLPRARR